MYNFMGTLIQKIFIIASLAHSYELNAMELVPVDADKQLSNCEILQKMVLCFDLMICLEKEELLERDVTILVVHNLFYLEIITKLSCDLKEYRAIPWAIQLIENLYEAYGHVLAGILLKMALADGNISICDIKNKVDGICLKHFYRRHKRYPNGISMILYAAGNEALDLITRQAFLEESVWEEVLRDNREDIFNLFIDLAVAHNRVKELLSKQALCLVVYNGNAAIFRKLLAHADKFGLTQELLTKEDCFGEIVARCVNRCPVESRNELFKIMKSYLPNNQ